MRPSFVRLVTLEIVVAEGGTVSFADENGATLVCPEDCSAVYPTGTTVKLNATPNEGYADPDWQREACLPGPDCTVELDGDTTVTPVFGRVALLKLTLRGKGTGAVSAMTRRSGVGIDDAASPSSKGEPYDWWPSQRTTPSSSHGEETPKTAPAPSSVRS